MKIGIINPYFETLGGGERYVLTIAKCLLRGNEVDIFWDDRFLAEKALQKFNISLEGVNFVHSKINLFNKLILAKYDAIFYVTDGSLFFSPAKRNLLIVQSPAHLPAKTLINNLKLKNWSLVCYSKFMARIVKSRLGISATVLFVPVNLNDFKSGKKENIILSVGRFFPWLHQKKQEVLIKAFRKMLKDGLDGWELYLVGSVDPGAANYLKNIKKSASGLPVKILVDVSFSRLRDLYSKTKIYWHAAGFGEDLEKYPEKAEHFGVSTVEAMAAGCVPVVFGGGGQLEVVEHGINGFLWKSEEELMDGTMKIINDPERWQTLSLMARKRAQDFSQEKFCQKIHEIIKS